MVKRLIGSFLNSSRKSILLLAPRQTGVFRTTGGAEVDLILEDGSNLFAIEAKATKKVSTADFRGLSSFAGFVGKRKCRSFVVSMDERVQEFDDGVAIPLTKLWARLGWKP